MLAGTTELLAGAGYRVTSADLTIIAEQPKLAWFIPSMSERLSEVVGATVSVKATTVEVSVRWVVKKESVRALWC